MHIDRTAWLWILAIVITLGSVAFQRMTGPSYPVGAKRTLPSGATLKCRLPTSHVTTSDASVVIPASAEVVAGEISWRRVNSRDEWQILLMDRRRDSLMSNLPKQAAAGKIEYTVILTTATGTRLPLNESPIVMRFKGPVPIGILAPHIVCMFLSMLFATRTGLEAVAKRKAAQRFAIWTAGLLFVGGLILGPIVQKYAFGAFWTGWPFGHDLTDNKTAVAMLFWAVSIWRGWKGKDAHWWYVSAAVVHLLVYLIPHSVLGSELDYSPGENK